MSATAKAIELKVSVVGTKCCGRLVLWNRVSVSGQIEKVIMNRSMLLQASIV